MPKYTYSLEIDYKGEWRAYKSYLPLGYAQGYFEATRGSMPRSKQRMVRSDGKVMAEFDEYPDVGIGMVAGFPSPEQYRHAAQRALEKADRIEKYNKKRKNA